MLLLLILVCLSINFKINHQISKIILDFKHTYIDIDFPKKLNLDFAAKYHKIEEAVNAILHTILGLVKMSQEEYAKSDKQHKPHLLESAYFAHHLHKTVRKQFASIFRPTLFQGDVDLNNSDDILDSDHATKGQAFNLLKQMITVNNSQQLSGEESALSMASIFAYMGDVLKYEGLVEESVGLFEHASEAVPSSSKHFLNVVHAKLYHEYSLSPLLSSIRGFYERNPTLSIGGVSCEDVLGVYDSFMDGSLGDDDNNWFIQKWKCDLSSLPSPPTTTTSSSSSETQETTLWNLERTCGPIENPIQLLDGMVEEVVSSDVTWVDEMKVDEKICLLGLHFTFIKILFLCQLIPRNQNKEKKKEEEDRNLLNTHNPPYRLILNIAQLFFNQQMHLFSHLISTTNARNEVFIIFIEY